MSVSAAVNDAWERNPRRFEQRALLPPKNGKDRMVFCFCYGDKFNGDNHEEALSYARFCVLYLKGMRLPPYDTH
jgi:hypothetical protein